MNPVKVKPTLVNPFLATYEAICPSCNQIIYPLTIDMLPSKRTCTSCQKELLITQPDLKVNVIEEA